VNNQYLINLIENGFECDYLDFKENSYSPKNKFELIKDIMAMANSKHDGDKYIITGIKEKAFEENKIAGIDINEHIDSAHYHDLILKNIEPDIHFDYFHLQYKDKWLGIFKIYNNANRPYMLKKKYGGYREGYCVIRKGSHTCTAVRSDYDFFYTQQENFEVSFLENSLHGVYVKEGSAGIRVAVRNLKKIPITLIYGTLYIKNMSNQIVSKHPVYGFNKRSQEEFKLYMPAQHEEVGELFVAFGSTDCLRLELNEYGTTEQRYNFELIFGDAQNNEYSAYLSEGHVFATGKFLWKVQLRSSNIE
jgi:hypothetical protein